MSEDILTPQEKRIMIVPFGLERDRIVDGCTAYAVNVVYLITNPKFIKNTDDIPAVYKYSYEFSESIANEFQNTYRLIRTKEAKLNSFPDCIRVLKEIYQKENKSGKLQEILINVSTASKAFSLASYIFALFHPAKTRIFYMSTSNYILLNHLEDDKGSIRHLKDEFRKYGLTKGPYQIDEIPLLPIINFSLIETEFIKVFVKQEKFDSIDNFMENLPESFKNINRVKVRRVLMGLEKRNLIHVRKSGRYQEIYVSKLLKQIYELI